MKFKKLLAAALSAVLLGTTSTVAFAAPPISPAPKTYEYVAFGDSIAAGFGLADGDLANDPALILSENLIANPVSGAYAAVFGEYLNELGQERGYQTRTTNLSMTAYRAEDVSRVITTPGFKGEIASWILDTFGAPGTSDYLIPYHDLVNTYLPTADLVSIQLGGNDIIMSAIFPMVNSDNPVTQSAAISACLILFGHDLKTAIGGGLQLLLSNKDKITNDSLADFSKNITEMISSFEGYVNASAENVRTVVDTVKSVNDEAQIALINMFNPYGNSPVYKRQVIDISTVVTSIYQKAAELFCTGKFQSDDAADDEDIIPDSELNKETLKLKADEAAQAIAELEIVSALYEKYKSVTNKMINEIIAPIVNTCKVKAAELTEIAKEQIGYTIQYLALGKTLDPYIRLLNTKLADIAADTDSIYVDVYNISNEFKLDPHPTAEGHKEIADIMWGNLKDTIADSMPVDELINNSYLKSDKIKVGSSVKVKAAAEGGTGNYQYAFYYKKVKNGTLRRVRDFSEQDYCSIKPSIAAKYEVVVKVKNSTGTIVSKTFPLQVTSN